jgi:hypothetical protein
MSSSITWWLSFTQAILVATTVGADWDTLDESAHMLPDHGGVIQIVCR